MAERNKTLLERLGRWRYVLLVAAVGLGLLLWPTGRTAAPSSLTQGFSSSQSSEEERLASLLSAMEGVGRVQVLLSENGAAVVCQGADSAAVRLDVAEAMRCYTGLGADRIVIYKMNESWRERS